jgi:hypothetical protein
MEIGTYSSELQLCSNSIVSQEFTEPEGSLPHSQELSNCPYNEPHQSSKYHLIMPLRDQS